MFKDVGDFVCLNAGEYSRLNFQKDPNSDSLKIMASPNRVPNSVAARQRQLPTLQHVDGYIWQGMTSY